MKFKYVTTGTRDVKGAKTISEVFGFKREPVLPYTSLGAMESAMKGMNLLDIQSLAVELGIKPHGDRNRLVKACGEQYERTVKTYGSAMPTEKPAVFDPSSI